MELKNEAGKVIGRQTLTLPCGFICSQDGTGGYQVLQFPAPLTTLTFTDVKAGDMSDRLSISAGSTSGGSGRQAASAKPISVKTFAEYHRMKRDLGYEIGDIGPGFGMVFYSSGGKNLEAVPVEREFQTYYVSVAVEKCREIIYGGARDWRLPDKDELNWMYQNLKRKGLGNFKDNRYRSSSPSEWTQDFSNGKQSNSIILGNDYVRAIRSF